MDSKLCEDMVKIEILSRTSLKTLESMRCINKEFEKLAYEPYLLDLYKQRNNIVSGFLLENNKPGNHIKGFAPSHGSNNIDLGFLPRNARILASSEQGIIVFECPHPKTPRLISYYVCKPTTKQVFELPKPKTKYLTKKVAIIVVGSKPLHFKIVRLSSCSESKKRDESYMTYRCEIFDSRKWAWKLHDHLMLPYPVLVDYPQPITTRGSIYMLLTNNEILKFDAYNENWSIFSSPIPTPDFSSLDPIFDYESKQLIKHEGKLGFACKLCDGCWGIWILGIDEVWEKIYVFNEEEDINVRKVFNDPNTSIIMDFFSVLFYSRNTISKVVLNDRYYDMFVYRSDFEPINLMGREN